MDLYEVLGVSKDASQDDISKAYRAKSKSSHPDAGGDMDKMMLLNRAYATLKDPLKREQYDRTGEEPQNALREDGIRILMNHFLKALQENPPADYVDWVRARILADVRKLRQDHQRGQQLKATFEQRRKRVKPKKRKKKQITVNLWEHLVNDQLRNVERGLAACELDIKRHEHALELLENYEGVEAELGAAMMAQLGPTSTFKITWG